MCQKSLHNSHTCFNLVMIHVLHYIVSYAKVRVYQACALSTMVGVEQNFRRKLMRSRLKWAGHVEIIEGELLTKRADAFRVEGRRRRGSQD